MVLSILITVWVLENARKEIAATGRGPEINGVLLALEHDGRTPSSWFHHETAEFDALGPPGTTIRVYYARHAGQVIVLHAAEGKHGAGKLAMRTKRTVTRRLASWKRSYPKGRSR